MSGQTADGVGMTGIISDTHGISFPEAEPPQPFHFSSNLPKRLAYYSDAPIPAALNQAAQSLNVQVITHPLAALFDEGGLIRELTWIGFAASPDEAQISAIADLARRGGTAILLDAMGDALDHLWSRFEDDPGIAILSRPGAQECLVALAQAIRDRTPSLAEDAPQSDAQLERLRLEVQRISEVLAQLNVDGVSTAERTSPAAPVEMGMGVPTNADAATAGALFQGPVVTARYIRDMIRQRRLRERFFPAEIFADPAWDMLLDLYAAHLEKGRVSVSSLCIAAAVPATTALRWIRTLTESGMFLRVADPRDGRRIFVVLSDGAIAAMGAYFDKLASD